MTAVMSLRIHAAEVSRAFELAVEDANDSELVDVVERAAWAVLYAAERERQTCPTSMGWRVTR